MSRFKHKLGVVLVIIFIVLLKWWFMNNTVRIIYRERKYSLAPKTILVWNKDDLWGFKDDSNQAFFDYKCPVANCLITRDRDKLDEAHAVVFHKDLKDKPSYKYTDQRWVLVSLESPCHIYLDKEENLVNWTQTYRLDSDIFMPYGVYFRKKKPRKIDFKSIITKKTKLAAWFVSNCHTHGSRKSYVKELQKYIDVDIFGRCSSLYGSDTVCKHRNACYKKLNSTYKFYLSFENSFHTDYISEKYWRMLNYFIVPVVRGGGNYSNARIAMPNSFINANDFHSPHELANYLLYLDKHDSLYLEYLKHFQVHDSYDARPMFYKDGRDYSFCQLCRKLNNESERPKYYTDVRKWFGECEKPSDVTDKTRFLSYLYEKISTGLKKHRIIET